MSSLVYHSFAVFVGFLDTATCLTVTRSDRSWEYPRCRQLGVVLSRRQSRPALTTQLRQEHHAYIVDVSKKPDGIAEDHLYSSDKLDILPRYIEDK